MNSEAEPIEPKPENVPELENRLNDLREKRAEIRSQLERAEGELEDARTAYAGDGGTVSAITEAQSETDALQGTLSRLNEEIEAVRGRLETARDRREERHRRKRLVSAARDARDAWNEYESALQGAREYLRDALDRAVAAKKELRDARERFRSDAGRSREEMESAAREILEDLDSDGRTGLSRLLGRHVAAGISAIETPSEGVDFDVSPYNRHPCDRPDLVNELESAVRTLMPTK
jgi:chromosome segregation ATPase